MFRRLWITCLRWQRDFAQADLLSIVLPLTLLVLALNPFDEWYMQGPFAMLCIIGLAWRPALGTTLFWYFAAAVFGAAIYLNWASADNHKYLMCYWCLALCAVASVRSDARDAALAWNARLLIGLCMALAIFWRLTSNSYRDGAFFEFCLLTDERFEYFGRWAGDATGSMLAANRQLKELLLTGHLRGMAIDAVRLESSPGLVFWAQFLTWWTVALEGSIAACFLLPDSRAAAWVRNGLLLLFGLTTYSVAPVRGFGWMLMLLGLAQCDRRDGDFRWAYLAAMLAIQAYTIPYGPLVDGLLALFA